MFADDAKFFRHIVQQHDISIPQQAIDALRHWTQKWLLSLNIKKCKVFFTAEMLTNPIHTN